MRRWIGRSPPSRHRGRGALLTGYIAGTRFAALFLFAYPVRVAIACARGAPAVGLADPSTTTCPSTTAPGRIYAACTGCCASRRGRASMSHALCAYGRAGEAMPTASSSSTPGTHRMDVSLGGGPLRHLFRGPRAGDHLPHLHPPSWATSTRSTTASAPAQGSRAGRPRASRASCPTATTRSSCCRAT